MTTQTTQNVSPTHQHSFSAQGVCGCGLTHDQWRAEHEAGLAPAVEQPAAVEEPAAEPEQVEPVEE